ncbi:MAG: ribosome-associated translation inhibitor RaiA [Pseudomonadota bacterium]
MQVSVTFRHMEATDAIKEYAREKVERIKKYFPDPIAAHLVLSIERGYQHVADVNIQLHNGIAIKGREITEDMYSSIDLVMAKIERQVRRYKEKIRHHKAQTDISQIPVAYSILEARSLETASDLEEMEPAAEARRGAETVPAVTDVVPDRKHEPTIIKTSKFFAQPLSVEDAVMQMNLLENSFLVFRNIGTGEVNVVYRRDDGNYGLIESGPPSSAA